MSNTSPRAMICVRCSLSATLLLGVGLLLAPSAYSQTAEGGATSASQVLGASNLRPADVPPPYENVFRDVSLGATLEPKIGPGEAQVDFPSIRAPSIGLPIQRGARPDNATFKIGNFYLNLDRLIGAVLYSDNVNAVTAPRKGGVIGIVALDLTAVYQITEGLNVAGHAQLVYLPLANKVGLTGFTGLPNMGVVLGYDPALHTQLSYDFLLGGWQCRVFDDFIVGGFPLFDVQSPAFVPGAQTSVQAVDQTGRYFYGVSGNGSSGPSYSDAPRSQGINENQFLIYQNTVGATMTRLLPTVTRATLSYYHSNIWYNQPIIGSTSERDTFYGNLSSERENTRFKPFLTYTSSSYDGRRTWDKEILGGVQGPVTDNLDFLGDIGYYQGAGTVSSSMVWDIIFIHHPGPLTTQILTYQRITTQPIVETETRLRYDLQRILGPYLTASLYGERDTFDDLSGFNSNSERWQAGIDFFMVGGPRLNFNYGIAYETEKFENAAFGNNSTFIGHFIADYFYSERTTATLGYRYENQHQVGYNLSYYENLVYLQITRRF